MNSGKIVVCGGWIHREQLHSPHVVDLARCLEKTYHWIDDQIAKKSAARA